MTEPPVCAECGAPVINVPIKVGTWQAGALEKQRLLCSEDPDHDIKGSARS